MRFSKGQNIPIEFIDALPKDDALRPRILRKNNIMPEFDALIEARHSKNLSPAQQVSIHMIKTYRRIRPIAIGNRCAFDPSCSHYAEIAIESNGFWRGVRLTMNRLRRCHKDAGGQDMPESFIKHLEQEKL